MTPVSPLPPKPIRMGSLSQTEGDAYDIDGNLTTQDVTDANSNTTRHHLRYQWQQDRRDFGLRHRGRLRNGLHLQHRWQVNPGGRSGRQYHQLRLHPRGETSITDPLQQYHRKDLRYSGSVGIGYQSRWRGDCLQLRWCRPGKRRSVVRQRRHDRGRY